MITHETMTLRGGALDGESVIVARQKDGKLPDRIVASATVEGRDSNFPLLKPGTYKFCPHGERRFFYYFHLLAKGFAYVDRRQTA